MASDALAGVWAKIRRADAHLRELETHDERLDRLCRDALVMAYDEPADRYVVRLTSIPEIPDDFSLILGDAVHNYRAALDHLAQAVTAGQSGVPGDRTAFPILTVAPNPNAQGQPGRVPMNPPVPDEVQAELQRVQPYQRQHPDAHDLAILNALDIADKHRRIIVAIVAVQGVGWWGDWSLVQLDLHPAAPGDEVAVFAWEGDGLPAGIPDLRFGVSVADAAAGGMARVRSAASYLREHLRPYLVDELIPRFVRFVWAAGDRWARSDKRLG